jgi:hypothetical protein
MCRETSSREGSLPLLQTSHLTHHLVCIDILMSDKNDEYGIEIVLLSHQIRDLRDYANDVCREIIRILVFFQSSTLPEFEKPLLNDFGVLLSRPSKMGLWPSA